MDDCRSRPASPQRAPRSNAAGRAASTRARRPRLDWAGSGWEPSVEGSWTAPPEGQTEPRCAGARRRRLERSPGGGNGLFPESRPRKRNAARSCCRGERQIAPQRSGRLPPAANGSATPPATSWNVRASSNSPCCPSSLSTARDKKLRAALTRVGRPRGRCHARAHLRPDEGPPRRPMVVNSRSRAAEVAIVGFLSPLGRVNRYPRGPLEVGRHQSRRHQGRATKAAGAAPHDTPRLSSAPRPSLR